MTCKIGTCWLPQVEAHYEKIHAQRLPQLEVKTYIVCVRCQYGKSHQLSIYHAKSQISKQRNH